VYAVRVCRSSGLLPTKGCEDLVTELFLEGTIPTEYCYDCKGGGGDKSFNVEIFKRKKSAPESGGAWGRKRGAVPEAGSTSDGEGIDAPAGPAGAGGNIDEAVEEMGGTPYERETVPRGADGGAQNDADRNKGVEPSGIDEKMEILLND